MNRFRKILAFTLCTVLGLSAVLGSTGCSSDKKVLNVLTWADYIPGDVVKDFEKETGIKVNYSTFGDNEEMYAKLKAQKNSYDIVVCSNYIIPQMIDENMLEPIDKNKVKNYDNLNQVYLNQYYDPMNKYSAPYTAYALVMLYDEAAVGHEINGYNDLWDEALKEKIVLACEKRELIGLVLQSLGYSLNDTDPAHLEEAENKLMLFKENILRFDPDYPHNSMIQGDATVGLMYPSQAVAALEEKPELKVCYAEEGMSIGTDNVIIPSGAPNLENAFTFMNYILDGKVSAKISSIINYANTNNAAAEFLPQSFLDNQIVNLPADKLKNAETIRLMGDKESLYDQIWDRFMSK